MKSPTEVLEHYEDKWMSQWSEVAGKSNFFYLLSCPTTDITQPYHSYSYLSAALKLAGIPYAVRDLGIEFWRYLISPPVVDELRRECWNRSHQASGDNRRILQSYAGLLVNNGRFESAWNELTSPRTFFQIENYVDAVKELSLLPRLLTLLSNGVVYRSFSSMSPAGMESDRFNLKKFQNAISSRFKIEVIDYFYEYHANSISKLAPRGAGFTIPFLSQLQHSFALSHLLKKKGIPVVMGGPIAAKFYKYSENVDDLGMLAFGADALVTGEAESVVPLIAERARSSGNFEGLTNTVSLERPARLKNFFFEDLNTLPTPDYSIFEYSNYASPAPGGLYSPTRGCYWNRCSFCDYGLAMGAPTSPWRTRSPQKVADDLGVAKKYLKYLFFSVDVLSPAYVRELTRVLVERKLGLKWMADFRLETAFSREMISLLKESGCLGAAFGMESGCQEVLDAMQKGIKADQLEQVVGDFTDFGIPVQLMGFTGFPGETPAQAQITFDVASRLSNIAATVALGKFGLTPGADVAKNPDLYNIEVLYTSNGDPAIPWELEWKHLGREGMPDNVDFTANLKLMRGFPYPFLGATTTLHSLLYFDKKRIAVEPLPCWSDALENGEHFKIIPTYFVLGKTDDGTMVQSGLTGRIIVMPEDLITILEAFFQPDARQLIYRAPSTPRESELIDFLTQHSLVMFLPLKGEKI
jgi:radical SAM family protein